MAYKARQKQTHTFSIDHYSEVDDTRYNGSFTAKKLSIRDLAALGVRKAQLNGGLHHDSENPGKGIDEQTDEFNSMIAHLELSLVDTPDWWDLDTISDMELMGKVYEEVVNFEYSFLGRGDSSTTASSNDGGSSERDSQKTEAESVTAGGAGTVVEGEVPTALEP